MIEPLIKPQTLDNDIAVMKIIHLLGQLSLNDLKYKNGNAAFEKTNLVLNSTDSNDFTFPPNLSLIHI